MLPKAFSFDDLEKDNPLRIPTAPLSDGWIFDPDTPFEDILNFMDKEELQHPDYRLLLLLDDLEQGDYTCSHAILEYGLDDYEEADLEGLPAQVFETNGDYIGYPTTTAEFSRRFRHFEAKLADEYPRLDEVALKETLADKYTEWSYLDWEIFLALMEEPTATIEQAFVYRVPVSQSWQLLAAYPNGYFEADLSPFDNALLAKVMTEQFDYQLFGIGSALLGFKRDKPCSHEEAEALANWLMAHYQMDQVEPEEDWETSDPRQHFAPKVIKHLMTYPYFFMTYVENAFEQFY